MLTLSSRLVSLVDRSDANRAISPAMRLISASAWRNTGVCVAISILLGALHPHDAAQAGQRMADPQNASATCNCPNPYDPGAPPGVIWQAPAPELRLADLARLLAPVLWFSSDEPLLVMRENGKIPQAHPCDRPSDVPIVYYQATHLVLRGDERVQEPAENDPRFMEKVDHFVLKYLFYYDEDWGLSPHAHDLEAVNVYVHLDRTREGCYRVRIPRVEGLAHGVEWYTNILRMQRDIAFPLTILVEEGKHASCPDRNSDGIYTPGYDVNFQVNDAWGLRDIVGSSVLLGARYSASMSKPRDTRFRLFPPEGVVSACATAGRSLKYVEGEALGRYELRPATAVPACPPDIPELERLLRMMQFHRFGPEWPIRQYDSDLERELSNPENATRWISALNARVESNRVGLVVQGPGVNLREVWVVPRGHYGRGWFVDALVTPSASRWADWYVAAGFEQLRRRDPGNADENNERIRGFASEFGLKFRVTAPGRARWALLGYRFGGVRIGVRANGFSRLQQPRMIIEIGAGAF